MVIGSSSQRRIVVTFLDQLVWSTTNFVTGLAVARLSGAAEFGKYMITLMIWFVVVGLHRSLISDPVIISSREAEDQTSLLREGVAAEILLGIVVTIVVAVLGAGVLPWSAHIAMTIFALCPWFVALLVQDYWRAMAFQQRRPGLALGNDLAFAVVQFVAVACFAMLGWRSAGHMISAWGLGAVTGALIGFRSFPGSARLSDGWALMRRLWSQSRWLLADFLTSFGANQAYLTVAALLISEADYGGLRAAINLMGPVVVIVHAGGNIGLPEASRRVDPKAPEVLRRFARSLSAWTTFCVSLYAILVAVGGRRLLILVYGAGFGRFAPLATLGAIEWVLAVTWFGQVIALKATGRMRRLWRARLLVTVASLVYLFALVRYFGTIGAAWAGVATTATYAVAVYTISYSEARRAVADDGVASPGSR